MAMAMAKSAMTLTLLACAGLVFPGTHADTSFQYYQFSDSSDSISVLGDARIHIDDLALELTTSAAGRATYDYPVRLLSATPAATSVSFETTFIFSIENEPSAPQSYGAGLTFHISSDNKSIGLPGGNLGLPTGTKFFALEFDTHQDAQFQDPNDNHVGIDFGSLVSQHSKSATSGSLPVTLASGTHIQAYIAYNSLAHILDVSIAPYSDRDYVKPAVSLLSVPIDFATVFSEYMFVGFSAATGAGVVRHKVWSWTFKTTTVDGMGTPVASAPDAEGYVGAPSPAPGGDGDLRGFGSSGAVIVRPAVVTAVLMWFCLFEVFLGAGIVE